MKMNFSLALVFLIIVVYKMDSFNTFDLILLLMISHKIIPKKIR